jgi:hypothetical protein
VYIITPGVIVAVAAGAHAAVTLVARPPALATAGALIASAEQSTAVVRTARMPASRRVGLDFVDLTAVPPVKVAPTGAGTRFFRRNDG